MPFGRQDPPLSAVLGLGAWLVACWWPAAGLCNKKKWPVSRCVVASMNGTCYGPIMATAAPVQPDSGTRRFTWIVLTTVTTDLAGLANACPAGWIGMNLLPFCADF